MQTINFELLSQHKDLMHAITTRSHGASIYGNNLAFHVNDNLDHVNKNHDTLAHDLNYPIERLVHMDQVHGDKIIAINNEHNFTQVPTCDAVMTQEKNTPLMVMVADCNPILMYDPIKKVIAAVHAGRAGIFSNIITKTVKRMQDEYKSAQQDILVAIGPSIRQCCYEVGSEIKEEATKLGYEYAIIQERKSYYIDLLSIAYQQLKEAGIRKENIETSQDCTACKTDTFYSYRAEKNHCGRFAGIIMLK